MNASVKCYLNRYSQGLFLLISVSYKDVGEVRSIKFQITCTKVALLHQTPETNSEVNLKLNNLKHENFSNRRWKHGDDLR